MSAFWGDYKYVRLMYGIHLGLLYGVSRYGVLDAPYYSVHGRSFVRACFTLHFGAQESQRHRAFLF